MRGGALTKSLQKLGVIWYDYVTWLEFLSNITQGGGFQSLEVSSNEIKKSKLQVPFINDMSIC